MNLVKKLERPDEQHLNHLSPKEAKKIKKEYSYILKERFRFDHGFGQVVDLIIAPSDGDHFNEYQREYKISRDGDRALKSYKTGDMTIYVVHLSEEDSETPQYTSLAEFIRKFQLEFDEK